MIPIPETPTLTFSSLSELGSLVLLFLSQANDYDTVFALAVMKANLLLHPLSSSFLQLLLGLRAFSPTAELHRSLFQGIF